MAGGYGAVLVGVSIPPTQPCKEEARRSIFDDFQNFMIFVKNWFVVYCGWALDTRGFCKFQFFNFLSISVFWVFLGGLQIWAGGSGAVLVGCLLYPSDAADELTRL